MTLSILSLFYCHQREDIAFLPNVCEKTFSFH